MGTSIVPAGAGRIFRLAVPVWANGKLTNVLRLESPVRSGAGLDEIRRQIFTVAGSATVLALVIAFFVSRSLARRVTRIRISLRRCSILHPPEALLGASNDELGALERTVHDVAARLRELFERWRLESSRSEAILSSMAEALWPWIGTACGVL